MEEDNKFSISSIYEEYMKYFNDLISTITNLKYKNFEKDIERLEILKNSLVEGNKRNIQITSNITKLYDDILAEMKEKIQRTQDNSRN